MLILKCPKHPRYTGKESPRASCEQCQWLHLTRTTALQGRLVEVKK